MFLVIAFALLLILLFILSIKPSKSDTNDTNLIETPEQKSEQIHTSPSTSKTINTAKSNVTSQTVLTYASAPTSVYGSRSNNLSEEGLSIPEILMLSYANKFHTGVNEFQQFWKYRYEVDAKLLLDKLYRTGYISLAAPAVSLSNKTVSELKSILKENNLPVSGRKQDLIDRIVNNLNKTKLKKYCKHSYYMLTDKGLSIVDKYPNVLYSHRHPDISFSNKNILTTKENAQDLALEKYNSQLQYYMSRNEWGLVRNSHLGLSEIYTEKKNYKSALQHAFITSFIDVSGISSRYALEHGMAKPGENNCCTILPRFVKTISDLIDKSDISFEEFKSLCNDWINFIYLPYSYYDKNTIKDIIITEISAFKGLS